jgi:hypothetical protein
MRPLDVAEWWTDDDRHYLLRETGVILERRRRQWVPVDTIPDHMTVAQYARDLCCTGFKIRFLLPQLNVFDEKPIRAR